MERKFQLTLSSTKILLKHFNLKRPQKKGWVAQKGKKITINTTTKNTITTVVQGLGLGLDLDPRDVMEILFT